MYWPIYKGAATMHCQNPWIRQELICNIVRFHCITLPLHYFTYSRVLCQPMLCCTKWPVLKHETTPFTKRDCVEVCALQVSQLRLEKNNFVHHQMDLFINTSSTLTASASCLKYFEIFCAFGLPPIVKTLSVKLNLSIVFQCRLYNYRAY